MQVTLSQPNVLYSREVAIMFHIEAGNLCYFYYESSKAKEHFNTATQLSGLEIGLTGALGKRTLFQENEISQLVLKVERLSSDVESKAERNVNPVDGHLLPKVYKDLYLYLLFLMTMLFYVS